ncbi:cell division protein FtsQ/DivIB [Virgibacillus byunsanensis]|uniref:Cell division protein DivIB n=1 Tax=Virgibacillus byunsanensis TaxID=570945 RepID=A0ABW3LJG9_9BACI
MSKKKIVSIEERIPKLKQARKKKANRRLIFYLSIFFLLLSIIVYLQSPLSNIKTIAVNGNSFVTTDEVIEVSNLTMDTNIWTINKKEIQQSISKNPVVESVEVIRKLPWTVEIQLTEYERVGYIKNQGSYYPILGNGVTLSSFKLDSMNGDAPLILDFTDEDYLNEMTNELKKLPDSILNLISEIYWSPTDENRNKILLYMNDGFVVNGTIRNFAEKMQVYPSIVSQLEAERKGIVHIGVGAYFEEYETEVEDEEVEDEVE